jgi:hypothetical protein
MIFGARTFDQNTELDGNGTLGDKSKSLSRDRRNFEVDVFLPYCREIGGLSGQDLLSYRMNYACKRLPQALP